MFSAVDTCKTRVTYAFIYLINAASLLTVNDTLDDILDESGDEEEQDAIVNQVLDEIGIEISGKVRLCKISLYGGVCLYLLRSFLLSCVAMVGDI